jgi:hypothetical protein
METLPENPEQAPDRVVLYVPNGDPPTSRRLTLERVREDDVPVEYVRRGER